MLFNGNFEDSNNEFDNYLTFHKYKFKDDTNEAGGYLVLKNKKSLLSIDIGKAVQKKIFKRLSGWIVIF